MPVVKAVVSGKTETFAILENPEDVAKRGSMTYLN